MPSDLADNTCTYGVKLFVVVCAIAGIVCSILAARNCEFISFVDTDGDPPDRADDPPFDTALAGSIGIFGFIITDVFNAAGPGTNGCVAYEDVFGQQSAYPSLATAQFCALIAPIFAGIATFADMVDLCIYNFNGSFMISSLLFLIAFGVQARTFTLVADPAFCLEDAELQCSTGQGLYLSIASTVLYFICSLLMCCAPRGDPFCYNFGFGPEKSKQQPRPPPETKVSAPQETKVIVQPVIIQTPVPDSSTSSDNEKRKTKKKKKNPTTSNTKNRRTKKDTKLSNEVV